LAIDFFAGAQKTCTDPAAPPRSHTREKISGNHKFLSTPPAGSARMGKKQNISVMAMAKGVPAKNSA
jgi:hypothetical protein